MNFLVKKVITNAVNQLVKKQQIKPHSNDRVSLVNAQGKTEYLTYDQMALQISNSLGNAAIMGFGIDPTEIVEICMELIPPPKPIDKKVDDEKQVSE